MLCRRKLLPPVSRQTLRSTLSQTLHSTLSPVSTSSPGNPFKSSLSLQNLIRTLKFNHLDMSHQSPPLKDAIALLMGNAKRKHQCPSPSTKNHKTLIEHEDGPLGKKPKTLERVKEESKKVMEEGGRSVNIDEKIALLKKKESEFKLKSAAFWKDGESILFVFLARAFDLISFESAKNVKINILCNVFRTVIATTPGDLVSFVYLSACKIYPAHDGIELGIGEAAIINILRKAYGKSEVVRKKALKCNEDLVLVIKKGRSSQPTVSKPAALTVAKVLNEFRVLAKDSGKGTQKRKMNDIIPLLVAACDCEAFYIIRLLQSKLKVGMAEQTVLEAFARAAAYSEKPSGSPSETSLSEAVKVIKQVHSVHPKYDTIVSALLSDGVLKLPEICTFVPGVPVSPLLASIQMGCLRLSDRFQNREFTCEYKYDGERAQIHYLEDGSVQIYSRNGKTNTGKFPDVIQSVQMFKKPSVSSFVQDCDVVAFDRKNSIIASFRKLRTRTPKNASEVPVCILAFDILYLNGELLLQEQLNVRRKHLYNSFLEVPGVFNFATQVTSNDLDAIQSFLDAAIADSCEGLIVKTLSKEATYEPAERSNNWLKLKKDYMDSIGDSLDLVAIGAYHGSGKRAKGYGSFLLACYDDDNEEFQCICKTGSGFYDEFLEECFSSFESQVIPYPKSYYRFTETTKPDVWFEPTDVWEVKAADLTISPAYVAAAGAADFAPVSTSSPCTRRQETRGSHNVRTDS